MRVGLIASLVCLCLVGLANADPAHASIRKTTNIPAEELGSALQTVAKDYDFQVLYRTEIVKDLRTQGAVGSLTSDEALGKVLKGTGLTYKYLDSNTVTIMPVVGGAAAGTTNQSPSDSSNGGGKKSSQDFRVAQVDKNAVGSQIASNNQNQTSIQSGGLALTEIIVTAQKRSERLQDVPVPVTVLTPQALLDSNQLRVQDYYTTVPGLSLTPGDLQGTPLLSIRGITTGGLTNPTVGIVVDDVPYGSTAETVYGGAVPDIDPNDLASIEVLRGPQGTLYGASTLGGLLKYVTVDPSTDAVSARVQVGASDVYHGAEVGYNVRASVNVPLSDTIAIRASGFTRQDPGYIDNVLTGQRGVNEGEVRGALLSALWRPSDVLSLKLSAIFQDTSVHGSSYAYVEPGLTDLQQSAIRGTGVDEKRLQAYSATLKAKWGTFDFTSVTGFNTNSVSDSFDLTYDIGSFTYSQFNVTGSPLFENYKTTKFTEELRLSTPVGPRIDWQFGLFYSHERSPYQETQLAADPISGAAVGEWFTSAAPQTASEIAAFTDLTLRLTDFFDIQFGARESQDRETGADTITSSNPNAFLNYFGAPPPIVYPVLATTENSFTYLVTPRYKISPDFMLYARFASGFRPGGPNPNATAFGLPPSYRPDTTHNYEVGAKGDVFDHVLSFDASVYYIDWKDLQLFLLSATGAGYNANGGGAKSQGVELSVESRPVTGMKLAAWVAWDDAVLTQAFPAASTAYGLPGDRLPYSARFSGNFSLEQEFSLVNHWRGLVAGSESYVGDRIGEFTGSIQRQLLPAYAITTLRTGARDKYWSINLFLDNAFDKRAPLAGGIGTVVPIAFNYIQPRTVGLSVARSF